jgi:hypothetical protein
MACVDSSLADGVDGKFLLMDIKPELNAKRAKLDLSSPVRVAIVVNFCSMPALSLS